MSSLGGRAERGMVEAMRCLGVRRDRVDDERTMPRAVPQARGSGTGQRCEKTGEPQGCRLHGRCERRVEKRRAGVRVASRVAVRPRVAVGGESRGGARVGMWWSGRASFR